MLCEQVFAAEHASNKHSTIEAPMSDHGDRRRLVHWNVDQALFPRANDPLPFSSYPFFCLRMIYQNADNTKYELYTTMT